MPYENIGNIKFPGQKAWANVEMYQSNNTKTISN